VKRGLLDLADHAIAMGWSARKAAGRLGLDPTRLRRWQKHQEHNSLSNQRPGAPLHGLLDAERAAILALYDEWGQVDRSYRKLAYRGSRLGVVHVSESTLRRVLATERTALTGMRQREPTPRRPRRLPPGVDSDPNQVWVYDCTYFSRSGRSAWALMDGFSHKWLITLVTDQEPDLISDALEAAYLTAVKTESVSDIDLVGRVGPLLIGMPLNEQRGPAPVGLRFEVPMVTGRGRSGLLPPSEPIWVNTLFGYVREEWPHLDRIKDAGELEAELERVRLVYNSVRLQAALGYVTPDDSHTGRGELIRQARRDQLAGSRQKRIDYRRSE